MKESKRYYVDLDESFTDIKYRFTEKEPHSIGYHHHDGLEIIQIWSKGGTVFIGDSIYPIKKGCLYLIDSSTAHCTNPDPNSAYIRSKLTFTPSVLIPLLKTTNSMYLLNLFTNNSNGNIIELDADTAKGFDECFKLLSDEFEQKDRGYHLLMVSILITLLSKIDRIKRDSSGLEIKSSINPVVLSILDYINQSMSKDINIDDICSNLHFSKYYLCHTFKKNTGVTILQYIIERKIANAKFLLTNTKKTISEIAQESGFNGLTQFSRTFSRTTGTSPIKYRKLKSSDLQL